MLYPREGLWRKLGNVYTARGEKGKAYCFRVGLKDKSDLDTRRYCR